MARAKEFDEDAVLLKATRLYWEQGYEKTSINDLVEHMGIQRRSLYDTFGGKHQLFLKVIDRYGMLVNESFQAGIAKAGSSREALRFLLHYTIDGYEGKPSGCLFVNTATELANRDPEANEKTEEGFNGMEQLLVDLIRAGQRSGEFSTAIDAEELAENIHAVSLGLRVLARTSTDRTKMHRIADTALAALDV